MVEKLDIKSDAPGERLFLLGNEAIARGAIEAGVQVSAAYPGTPSTEIMETLVPIAKYFDMYVEWSVNEKVAFEVALAASICGVRAMSMMKHVGVNVALDPIMTAEYIGAKGGLVLVSADDPGQWSSQTEQDNRYIAEQAYIPVLEPSSVQEAKDMVISAFELSEEFGQPFMLRSETRIGHARGDVVLGEIFKIHRTGKFEKDVQKLVTMPAHARINRKLMVERLTKIKEAVNTLPFNQLKLNTAAKLGVIASGISYSYALEALRWLDLENKVSLLKVGTPYPLPEKLIWELLRSVPEMLVIEELEPIIEDHVRAIAQKAGLGVKIYGKEMVPVVGELSTRKVTEVLAKLTGNQLPVDFTNLDNLEKEVTPLIPLRPPALCAGCPHRATFYAINQACEKVKKETGLEPIKSGDIGCYGLGVNPPLNSDDIATCMGSGFDIANGLAKVLKVPIVGHLGDSTFFHSGIPPMLNAVFNRTRMTMVVMDNGTTAMTGMQPNPSSGQNANSQVVPQIRPEEIARASGVEFVEVFDLQDLKKAIDILEKAIKFEGPSLVVSRRHCNILEQRERKARGEKIIPYHVEESKCVANSMPFCTASCPLHVDVRGYVKLVSEGNYTAALKLIREKLPFPAIMGRICTRPCESKCKRGEANESIAIAALKRSAVDYAKGNEVDLSIAKRQPEKVAVVGSGPAGLMAAYDLRKMGYQVTIFEALPVLGGMLAAGIPEYRLPRKILESEVGIIAKLGVEVRLNTRIGLDIELNQLHKDYDAVFIAVGAHRGRNLGVENEQAKGVVKGIEFLRNINLGQAVEIKNKVLIVGGGNVAIDCARVCLRKGFKSVNIIYRRSRIEMPAINEEVYAAEQEGVKFHFLATPVRVLSDGDRVIGAECIRMELGSPDTSGRRRPLPLAGSDFQFETDLIIAATGEEPDLNFSNSLETPISIREGLLVVDSLTLATNIAGIFAGGDGVTGPGNVLDALASGRKAAISIGRYLRREPLDSGRDSEGTQLSPLRMEIEGVSPKPRQNMRSLAPELRTGTFEEVELGFSQEQAREEALRCLACGCQTCIKSLGCPAIVIEAGKITIDSSQCPGCGLCAQICPEEAILQDGNQ